MKDGKKGLAERILRQALARAEASARRPGMDVLEAALRNATLQGAYFMLAARASGLDCGPMSGFNAGKVDAEFFPDGQWKSNFLCCLGRGDPSQLPKRDDRFAFDEVCRIL